jgi:hypothetical protein
MPLIKGESAIAARIKLFAMSIDRKCFKSKLQLDELKYEN